MQHTPELNEILISIVVPVYNVEDYLPQCIESLLVQTHSNIEIILVDDGSTDSSGSICDSYAARDSRITVIHQENGGLSAARNAGIQTAKGGYIGFLDSDDFVDKNMFRSLLEAVIYHKADVAACGRYITDDEGNVTGKEFTPSERKTYATAEAMEQILLGGELDVAAWDKLFRTDLFENIEFPVGRINEDAAIIFHILAKTTSVVHVGKPFYYYRTRSGSITKSGYKPNKIQAMEHAQMITEFVCGKYPELERACRKYTAYLSCQLLSLMLKEPENCKRYRAHYDCYMDSFCENLWFLYSNSNVSPAWKVRGTLIWMRLYAFIYSVLRKRRAK